MATNRASTFLYEADGWRWKRRDRSWLVQLTAPRYLRKVKRLARLLISFVLVVSVALSGSWEAILFSCGMDGQVRTTCCCPHEEGGQAGPQLTATDDCCCDVSVVKATPFLGLDPITVESPDSPDLVAVVPAWTLPPVRLGPSRRIAPAGPRAPPEPAGPPIYIEVCSLLI